jgi:hypothetical protein
VIAAQIGGWNSVREPVIGNVAFSKVGVRWALGNLPSFPTRTSRATGSNKPNASWRVGSATAQRPGCIPCALYTAAASGDER